MSGLSSRSVRKLNLKEQSRWFFKRSGEHNLREKTKKQKNKRTCHEYMGSDFPSGRPCVEKLLC